MRTLLLVIAALALAAGVASAHPSGRVVASGGGVSSGGGIVLHGTVGQPAVGVSGGPANLLCHGYWCFGGSRVLAVDPPGAGDGLPAQIAFGLPSPSPGRGAVSFALALPADAGVKLAVFDVAGRAVGEPLALRLEAGYHQLRWQPLDGRPGVYFGVLEVDGAVQGRRRIVMVR